MRTLSVLGLTILSLAPLSSFAQSADPEPSQAPGASDAPPPAPPPPVAAEPAPPPPAPPPPAANTSGLPPINITITNTNTNPVTTTNTNTNPNTNTNTNTNPHTNTNTSTNTNTATAAATMAPPAPVAAAPIALRPPGATIERYTLSTPRQSARWILLGAIAGDHALGVRGSIDLITRGAWALGISASSSGDGGHGGGGGDRERGDRHDRGGRDRDGGRGGGGTATVYLARTTSLFGFDVRAQLGAGVAFGDGRGRDGGDTEIARTTTGESTQPTSDRHDGGRAAPIAQAAFLVGRPLSAHWGITAGPVVTASGKGGDERGHDAPVDVTLFAGLRYRL